MLETRTTATSADGEAAPDEAVFEYHRATILADENLRHVQNGQELRDALHSLSLELTEADAHATSKEQEVGGPRINSVFSQITFSNEHPSPLFEPNPWKKDVSTDGVKIGRHYRYAIRTEDVLVQALEYACDKEPSFVWTYLRNTTNSNNTTNKRWSSCSCNAEVLPSLYLGGFKCVGNLGFLKENGISAILNTAADLGGVFVQYPRYVEAAKSIDFGSNRRIDFLSVSWIDSAKQVLTRDDLETCLRFIDANLSKGRSVLVHCAQGRSRSSAVVVAYLAAKLQISIREALRQVQAKRRMAQPNPNFIDQLQSFEVQDELFRDFNFLDAWHSNGTL
ncbi:unnamed protein product [Amoebophrya sp. A25]|nr:unnamed protein product [Amoebophrya sp. A25]|eukprot:GSA25T00015334001.1